MTNSPTRIRTCVGCGAERPKTELLRIARSPAGGVSIDVSGRAQGRGAYICPNPECAKKAAAKNALSRVLRHQVGHELYAMVAELCGEKDERARPC
jgi:predicted RNA-binding protein YlxR (DUF448 family)